MKSFDEMFDLDHDGELNLLEKGAEMAFLSDCFFNDDDDENSDEDSDFDSDTDSDE